MNEVPATAATVRGHGIRKGYFPMRSDPTTSNVVSQGILSLTGFGCRLSVEQGALRIQDGSGDERRDLRFHRATCGIRRVVIHGHTGTISLDAIRWLYDIGAALIQIDHDGRVIFANLARGADYPALRRAQVMASMNETGVAITCELIRAKLSGQASVLGDLGRADVAEKFAQLVSTLDTANDLASIRGIEALGASWYWQAWESVPVRFARRDLTRVPGHWQTFGTRTSPLTSSPRRAATPANGLLNYLYAILEAETRIALLTVGLDPGIGFMHADQPSRDSLALDLMEAIRPEVDRWLYRWLQTVQLAARDFVETRDGTVRVMPRLSTQLSGTANEWARHIAPIAERLARRLAKPGSPLPTPLTERKRREGRRTVAPLRDDEPPELRTIPLSITIGPRTCPECGRVLPDRRRKFCSDACRKQHHHEVDTKRFAIAGQTALAQQREAGNDPAHGGEAKAKRVASKERRARERAEWEAVHGDGKAERERFVREIQPKLVGIPLSRIVDATGFSVRYASLIRSGEYVPHPVHYLALNGLVTDR